MNMLFINHGAKGIAMWDYPTEPGLANITSALSKVLTSSTVSDFLLGSFFQALEVQGVSRVDVAGWAQGNKMLISVVNKNYVNSAGANVSIALPGMAKGAGTVMWGQGWTVGGSGLSKVGLRALEVDIFVVNME